MMGWIILIGGILLGFILGAQFSDFQFVVAAPYWGGALVSSIPYLGFAQIIRLRNDIKHK